MCQTRHRWESVSKWNWDGDFVVHECIVPASRTIIGSRRTYDIDVREFLVNVRNEVIGRTLRRDMKRYVATLPDGAWERFESRQSGAFDYRARVLAGFVAENIEYRASARDPWQFPDETIALGAGDCEDRALLLASLLRASGVSAFHVRVALGKVRTTQGRRESSKDHVWVMYKNECGRWTVLDPPPPATRSDLAERAAGRKSPAKPVRADYEPLFLFNDVHLWAVRRGAHTPNFQEYVRSEWQRLDPQFIGSVHLSILEEALGGIAPELTQRLTQRFHRPVLGLFGPIIDDIDRRPYDPVEHFDNGYILDGWQRVSEHLDAFRQDNFGGTGRFALAAHAIADFYAHSSYSHFTGKVFDHAAFLADPAGYQQSIGLDYASGQFDLSDARFSVNPYYWKKPKAKVPATFEGQIISGRYAQEDDTQGDLLDHLLMEGMTWIPAHYLAEPDFALRGGLPHHNEIAVDEADFDASHHRLYRNATKYRSQFDRRKRMAIRHIRRAFRANVNA